MGQTELLEILKTMSSLRQNFTEIIARGVGAEPGPRPLQRPPLWEGPGEVVSNFCFLRSWYQDVGSQLGARRDVTPPQAPV